MPLGLNVWLDPIGLHVVLSHFIGHSQSSPILLKKILEHSFQLLLNFERREERLTLFLHL